MCFVVNHVCINNRDGCKKRAAFERRWPYSAVIPAAPGLESFIRENLLSFGGKIHTALEWECNGEDITMVYRCAGVAIEEVHHIVVNLLATYNSQ